METVKVDFVISPDGNDRNGGAPAKPFATLQRAREAVRQRLVEGESGDVVVRLRSGCYELDETFVLGLEDSPRAGSVTYAAWPGETPILSGGHEVTEWRRLEEPPAELPSKAEGNVWIADVPAGKARTAEAQPNSEHRSGRLPQVHIKEEPAAFPKA